MVCTAPTVGAARSRPPADGLECSVEWHHVGDRTNSPTLVTCCGIVLRGRLRASPTLAGRLLQPGTQKRYRALPRSPGYHTTPVRHAGTARQTTIYRSLRANMGLGYRIRQIRPEAPSLTILCRVPRNFPRTSSGIRISLAFRPSWIRSYTDLPKILLCQSFSGSSSRR